MIFNLLSFLIFQQCFLADLSPPTLPILNTTQIQCDGGDSRLVLRIAIAEYHMADSNGHSTLRRYTGEVMMSVSEYKQSISSKQ